MAQRIRNNVRRYQSRNGLIWRRCSALSAVLTLVSDTLRAIAEYSRNDRTEFIHTVQETQVAQQNADISKKRRRLAAAQKRAGELEKLICKIYEDNALGKLPDARYKALDAQYAKEQDALEIEIAELEKAVTGYEQSQKSAEKFIALIDKYENFDTLTNTMLNESKRQPGHHAGGLKSTSIFLGRYIHRPFFHEPLEKGSQGHHAGRKGFNWAGIWPAFCSRKSLSTNRRNGKNATTPSAGPSWSGGSKGRDPGRGHGEGLFYPVSQLPRQEPRKATVSASAAV